MESVNITGARLFVMFDIEKEEEEEDTYSTR